MNQEELGSLQNRVIEAVQLQDYPLARDLIKTAVELSAAEAGSDRYQKLLDEQIKVNRELEQKLNELQEPPLSRGLVLGASPDDPEKNLIVGAGGQRYEVRVAPNVGKPTELIPGWEAWLNNDRQVIKVRKPGSSGEAAEVTAILDDGRLEVKGHGNDEIIVDRILPLEGDALRVGDRVRIDPHLAVALEKLPAQENEDLKLDQVPDVTYADIGGLDAHIEQVRDAIELPYLYHQLFDRYHLQRPKGILLYGPPGCGKTLIAKAIANSLSTEITRNLTEIADTLRLLVRLRADGAEASELADAYRGWKRSVRRSGAGPEPVQAEPATDTDAIESDLLQFLATRGVAADVPEERLRQAEARLGETAHAYFMSIKGPELLNKYVGETEHSIRKLFIQAKRRASPATPVIMFFDEIEALFRRRGSRVTTDVESTIVPQFLSEMDGVEAIENVIIIGATNRQDLLDPAILRPGRLDAKIKIDRPGRNAARSIFGKYLTPALPIVGDEVLAAGSKEAAIERMIERAVAVLYRDTTRYQVAGKRVENGSKTFVCRDFASGAMIESIVSRSKRRAVRQEIDTGRQGIGWTDLQESIREELEQNKDPLVAGALGLSEEELSIELLIGGAEETAKEESAWLRPIRRPWAVEPRAVAGS